MRSLSFLHRAVSATVLTALVVGAPIPALGAGAKPPRRGSPAHPASHAVTHIGSAPTGTVRPTNEVTLSTGQGELINLPGNVSDVWISNPGVADVYVSNPRQIHLFGKDFGESTLFATSSNGAVIYSANIRVSQNLTSIDRMVKLAMPDSDIRVTTVGQIAVLTGTVVSPEDSAAAQRLVTGLLNPGVAPGTETGLKIGVINRLRAATPLQVNLQVRIAEVSRSFVKKIGVNLSSADSTGGFKFGLGQGRGPTQYTPGGALGTGVTTGNTGTSVISAVASGTTLAAAGRVLGVDLISSLDLGETDGQVSTLANPNITVISGETGSFLAGGEFPIPISQGLGAVSVEYKQYGVSLSYTPTVLSDGRISLHVRPEVSQLSSQGAVTLSGTNIPALTTRRAETTVELGSGQSMMIAGLLSNNHNNSIDKAPGLGDMPVLGTLFRSNNFQRNETELVIVITPYLVKPVNAADIVLPTDGYKAPTDLGRVIMGQLGEGTNGGDRPKPTMAPVDALPQGFGDAASATPMRAPMAPGERTTAAPLQALPAPARTPKKGATAAPGFSN
ncbi:type II and III secretion system protein family protein [Sphingomonas glacialis]|uniref:Type II and III secretion system protein family protein n=1 Tax=Sphingomonas glacialis TaxID=658225 RepID=A0A502G152_9SPHN|nr:type II and III secretion system protein family protein [Sphingomonas glacialis]TPG54823.1 type II and III secretion system protein family protein [Sphingomonas glacialis]